MIYERKFITHPTTRPALRPALRPDGARYRLGPVKKITAHWTANRDKGADADAHQRYFNNGAPGYGGKLRPASAHYVVDDGKVIQMIPESEVAFHAGDKNYGRNYAPLGRDLIYPKQPYPTPNYTTIGYEMCVNADGDFEQMEKNSMALAAWLLFRHNLTINDLVRHMDLTGKKCPQMYLDKDKWSLYRQQVEQGLQFIGSNFLNLTVTAKELNVRSAPGVHGSILFTLQQGEKVAGIQHSNGWVSILAFFGQQAFVNGKYLV